MTAFHAQTDVEWAFRKWFVGIHGYATVESVVSGPGANGTYKFPTCMYCEGNRNGFISMTRTMFLRFVKKYLN
jgi:hypothetical protein